jgi:S1-C subfamily serine protease
VIVQGTSYRLGGDIIVSVDGKQLSTFQQLRSAIDSHKPGDQLHFQVYRSGKQRSVTVTLGSK